MRAREKELGIAPDPEVDALLKAEAVEGKHSSIVTDLMLRVLGLEVCWRKHLRLCFCCLRIMFPASCYPALTRLDIISQISNGRQFGRLHCKLLLCTQCCLACLQVCADTVVGGGLLCGVSGGQRKRVTTGELMVGPAKTLLMDEISTGLDSSTTYLIARCIRNYVHLLEVSLAALGT
eukprot:GHRQ01025175.1.p1 GENE.GHRQ01025175.1~~GHRQ01025175.1.p1  ORF type:complete len:178 (-),score=50.39 GHRQ01025175.1:535-1068(-)